MKDIMNQANNKVTIVGKLLDASFATGKTSAGKAYERANLTVRVTQTYGGRTETSEVPVSAFATQYTNKGTINPAYENIQKLKEFKTVQNVGIDNADIIRMTSADLRENAFVSKSGQLVNGWQLNSSFFNPGKGDDTATFNIDIFIMDMKEEFDREGETTGRLVIKGAIVQYGGRLDVVEFIVEAPDCVDYISSNWNINDTVNVGGRVRYTVQEEKRAAAESSWGEEIPDTSTRTVRELIITRGSDEAFEEDMAYDATDIKKAFNERKARMEQMQLDAKTKGSKPAAPAQAPKKDYSWE